MRLRIPVVASLLVLGAVLFLIWCEPVPEKSVTTKEVAQKIDSAIWCLRHGDNSGASSNLRSAKDAYSKLGIENLDNELDNRIRGIFDNASQDPSEGSCHRLRGEVLRAANLAGAPLPLIYRHSPCLILLVSFLCGFLYAALLKVTTDWKRVKEIKAQVDDWRRRLNEARRRKDFKEIHKLTQEFSKLAPLQSELLMAQFKPTLFFFLFFIPLLLLLSHSYSGWVVAWLPFGLRLPFYGRWASCGVLSWLILSFGATSSLWRKLLIGE
jgi:uncharacterized membrane protein (DUF106 family)